MLLNPTAAWIFRYLHSPLVTLPLSPLPIQQAADYAEHFAIPLHQAQSDIASVQAALFSFQHLPAVAIEAVACPAEAAIEACLIQIGETIYQILVHSDELREEVTPRLEALRVRGEANPQHIFRLYEASDGVHIEKDGDYFARERLVTGARAQLLQELTRLAEPERDFRAVLHAGAVGNSEACIILAGPSFAGKSTICQALMECGMVCYSDDSACITEDYRVAGMPFALAMREGDRFRASNLNGGSPTAAVKALVFVKYEGAATATIFEPIDAFETLVALQLSGFWVQHTKPAIRDFLDWLASLRTYRLSYSDLKEALALVKTLVG